LLITWTLEKIALESELTEGEEEEVAGEVVRLSKDLGKLGIAWTFIE